MLIKNGEQMLGIFHLIEEDGKRFSVGISIHRLKESSQPFANLTATLLLLISIDPDVLVFQILDGRPTRGRQQPGESGRMVFNGRV